ncbi:hypothetical protein MPSEU_000958800 [Mayamaea pseudoterrestris]|nr:hypothetical protein MPSEU_000958800 [Mayamaea pseudoterrestris]
MLIELKLRNNLFCLQNDKVYVGIKPDDEALLERLDTIQDDAMTAIEQVQAVLDEQLDRLVEAVQENDDDDDDDDDDDATDDNDGGDDHVPEDYSERRRRNAQLSSRRSNHRRSLLEDKMSEYINDYSREETADDGTVQHFVSTRVMETLQDEVSHMLDSLQEKNSEVAHLKSTVDELTVRERSLMHELRRVMGEQAKIEAAERQRRMEAMKALDTDTDDDDGDPSSDDNEDDAGSGFASSVEFSDEDADYDEITYYEEVIE